MEKNKNDEWLKFKKYPHIGIPLISSKDKNWVKGYVRNPNNIKKHKFVPLLHRSLNQRKYRPIDPPIKNISGKRKREEKNKKVRHIYFPSHLDSIVYSYYNYLLIGYYEKYLENKPFNSVAVAYRRIPKDKSEKGNKSNIEFANEVFKFIDANKNRKLSVIVADVTSFFDNLDHKILHKQWKKILNVNDLPDDHYAVYKNLLNNSYVNENELFNRFKSKLIVERFKANNKEQKELKFKHVRKIYNIRRENVVAFCSNKDFFNEAKDLIRVKKLDNDTKRGIPQGTPISATLANIYMLEFDERIYNEVSSPQKNAYYQRYSDDLVIVCDQKDESFFYKLIRKEIEHEVKLDIQKKKTNIYRYELNQNSDFKGGILENDTINPNKQLEYLGFMYDGSKVRIKTAGFSKFYRKMKRSFRRGAHFAKKANIPSNSLFETRLYKKYTHFGSNRRLKRPINKHGNGYSRSTQYDWGNYITYVKKANNVMENINKEDTISKQYRKVWNKFYEIKKSTYEDINKKSFVKKNRKK